MAPTSSKGDYLPSSAHIFGIAVINDTISVPDKPRTLLLEAAFWNGQEPMLGLFRYFNTPGLRFESNQRCYIHSTVAKFDPEAVLKSHEYKSSPDADDEIDIMGDIFYIIPLEVNMAKYLPTILITGKPSRIAQDALTFDVDVGQWVNFSKEKTLFPFTGIVPRDGRWKDNNRPFPNPTSPKYMSVIGFLTGMVTRDDEKRFTVEIQSMHFLGSAPQTYPKTLTPTPKGKRKAGLDFDNGTPSKKSG